MSKTPEEMAEEYSFNYMLLDDPKYAMSITKKAFLAGYQAAKDEYKVAIDTYNDVAKQMMEEAVRIMSPKDQLADTSKVMCNTTMEEVKAVDTGELMPMTNLPTSAKWISVMALKAFTIDDIRSWQPCYDPSRHLPENWTGTAIDILKHESIPSNDKLWVVCREEVLNAKTLRLFAVWCARQVEHLMTDERSKNAIDVAERFANGNATQVELSAAGAAAGAAAWAAARDAQVAQLVKMLEEV